MTESNWRPDPAIRSPRYLAELAVKQAIYSGALPPAASQGCVLCGRPANVWHHHRGYALEQQLDVVALCLQCHRREHARFEAGWAMISPDFPPGPVQPRVARPVPDPMASPPPPAHRPDPQRPYAGPLSECTALGRPLPPWPGVMPLADAAALTGLEPDTLRKRVSRGHQPGFREGRRAMVVLLPHQWAAWSHRYQPIRQAPPRPEAGPLAAPIAEPLAEANLESPGHQGEDLAPLLRELEQLRRERMEMAGQVGYWMGRAQAAEAQLERAARRALPDHPAAWWRRWLLAIGIPAGSAATPAPPPQSE